MQKHSLGLFQYSQIEIVYIMHPKRWVYIICCNCVVVPYISLPITKFFGFVKVKIANIFPKFHR